MIVVEATDTRNQERKGKGMNYTFELDNVHFSSENNFIGHCCVQIANPPWNILFIRLQNFIGDCCVLSITNDGSRGEVQTKGLRYLKFWKWRDSSMYLPSSALTMLSHHTCCWLWTWFSSLKYHEIPIIAKFYACMHSPEWICFAFDAFCSFPKLLRAVMLPGEN